MSSPAQANGRNMPVDGATDTGEDRYRLNSIYFYLTDGCNLRCRHCWIEPTYETAKYASLQVELFESILEQAQPLGLAGVKFTGGEPFLHPHIHELIRRVHTEDLALTVETNGVLCTPELAEAIAQCKNRFVSVSLDGADRQTHEWMRAVDGCFDTALAGIRNLVDAGLRPQVIMTIMQRNKGQMGAVVRLAESLGAGSVKFNVVQPTARGETMHRKGLSIPMGELVELGAWVEGPLSDSTDLRLVFSHPAAFRPFGKMFAENNAMACGVCGILGILGVLADGSYALCGIGETVPDLVFGNAANDRLEDVWNKSRVLCDLREGMPHRLDGVCAQCLMKSRCLGACVAQNYYQTKDLWSANWYCSQAYEEGLFPETRLAPKSAVLP